jgi:hypothetical protein
MLVADDALVRALILLLEALHAKNDLKQNEEAPSNQTRVQSYDF